MVTVTPAAIQEIKALAGAEAPAKGLRIFIEKGGCSGLQYSMKVDAAQPGDTTIPCDEVSVYIDTESLGYLKGSVIDFEDGLTNRGFRIVNPNARQTCGCGTSFEA
jgi:iron-sulfur cluster assembly accessory protein